MRDAATMQRLLGGLSVASAFVADLLGFSINKSKKDINN
jgi:hypothetical protein